MREKNATSSKITAIICYHAVAEQLIAQLRLFFFLKNRTIPLTNSTPPSPWSSPPARGGFVTTHDSRVTTRSPVTTTATLLLYSQTGPLFVTLGKRSRKVPAFRVLLLLSPPRLPSPRHQISRQRSPGTPFFPLCFLCLLLPVAGDFPEVCLGGR